MHIFLKIYYFLNCLPLSTIVCRVIFTELIGINSHNCSLVVIICILFCLEIHGLELTVIINKTEHSIL